MGGTGFQKLVWKDMLLSLMPSQIELYKVWFGTVVLVVLYLDCIVVISAWESCVAR
jgi:hypothetical protein